MLISGWFCIALCSIANRSPDQSPAGEGGWGSPISPHLKELRGTRNGALLSGVQIRLIHSLGPVSLFNPGLRKILSKGFLYKNV